MIVAIVERHPSGLLCCETITVQWLLGCAFITLTVSGYFDDDNPTFFFPSSDCDIYICTFFVLQVESRMISQLSWRQWFSETATQAPCTGSEYSGGRALRYILGLYK